MVSMKTPINRTGQIGVDLDQEVPSK